MTGRCDVLSILSGLPSWQKRNGPSGLGSGERKQPPRTGRRRGRRHSNRILRQADAEGGDTRIGSSDRQKFSQTQPAGQDAHQALAHTPGPVGSLVQEIEVHEPGRSRSNSSILTYLGRNAGGDLQHRGRHRDAGATGIPRAQRRLLHGGASTGGAALFSVLSLLTPVLPRPRTSFSEIVGRTRTPQIATSSVDRETRRGGQVSHAVARMRYHAGPGGPAGA